MFKRETCREQAMLFKNHQYKVSFDKVYLFVYLQTQLFVFGGRGVLKQGEA